MFIFIFFLGGLTFVGLFVAQLPSFKTIYRMQTGGDAWNYVHVFLTLFIYMWAWEFLTRGFLLLGLKKYVGVYAVYIQLVPFVILHLEKPPFELYGSILFGLLFGYYAYMVDSFIYCAISHAYFAFMVKFFVSLG